MTESKNRIVGLDLMRAAAIVCVLIAHTNFFLGLAGDETRNFVFTLYFGFIGVELFFVLSGFLIGTILLKLYTRSSTFHWHVVRHFWVRRWFRTLPNYYLMLMVHFVFSWAVAKGDLPSSWQLLKYLLFLQNAATPHPYFFGVAWSLSIEEWFYLTFPVGLLIAQWLVPGKKARSFFLTICTFIVICTAGRCASALVENHNWEPWFRRVMSLRIDSIAIGVLMAAVKWFNYSWYDKYRSAHFAIGVFLFFVFSLIYYFDFLVHREGSVFLKTVFFPAFSLAIALLIPMLENVRLNPIMKSVVTYVSITSYSVYLSHALIMEWFALHTQYPVLTKLVLSWLSIAVISYLQYEYFERPFTSLRDKIGSIDDHVGYSEQNTS